MSTLFVKGCGPLYGTVKASGCKNSVLPLMAACLLAEGWSFLKNVPKLDDVRMMGDIMKDMGVIMCDDLHQGYIKINVESIFSNVKNYDRASRLRASFLVAGPLLARFKNCKVPLPGGCAIGNRPIDLHLKGFASMGAEIIQENGYIEAVAKDGLKGARIYLDFPSVGATENLIMAASLAEGETIIENAANEPEIEDLANFINKMGGNVYNAGTDTVVIRGVKSLKGTEHIAIPDRIEAGTFMIAAAITQGDVTVNNVIPEHLNPVTAKLREAGVEVYEELTAIRVAAKGPLKKIQIKTHPYPGFPTDMQAQMAALAAVSEGTSIITETVFENRFMYVGELKRMGASIKVDGRSAIIEGVPSLDGAKVKATDLRAGAALVVAGLAAKGVTEIMNSEHIDRGYNNIVGKLRALGADILYEE